MFVERGRVEQQKVSGTLSCGLNGVSATFYFAYKSVDLHPPVKIAVAVWSEREREKILFGVSFLYLVLFGNWSQGVTHKVSADIGESGDLKAFYKDGFFQAFKLQVTARLLSIRKQSVY